jgi:hypothetical protein
VDLILFTKTKPTHSWISKDGKDCPKSSSPAESYLGAWGRGQRGGRGAARLQILEGNLMWMGTFGSMEVIILLLFIIYYYEFWDGPNLVFICFRLFTLFAQRESYDA